MTLPTFVPGKNPIIGGQRDVNYRTLEANMGDGYSQVTVDGLNAAKASHNLEWNDLTITQMQTIMNQFDAYSGTSFLWQHPWDSVPKVWRCKKPQLNDGDGVRFAIVATFEQAFDLS